MRGRLTHRRARELRADALAQLEVAKVTAQGDWAEAQRKRIEFLDEYLGSHFLPDGRWRETLSQDDRIKTTTEDGDGPPA